MIFVHVCFSEEEHPFHVTTYRRMFIGRTNKYLICSSWHFHGTPLIVDHVYSALSDIAHRRLPSTCQATGAQVPSSFAFPSYKLIAIYPVIPSIKLSQIPSRVCTPPMHPFHSDNKTAFDKNIVSGCTPTAHISMVQGRAPELLPPVDSSHTMLLRPTCFRTIHSSRMPSSSVPHSRIHHTSDSTPTLPTTFYYSEPF